MAFPTSVDSFTTKADGVDIVRAADINNLQTSVLNIEKSLTGALSWATPLTIAGGISINGNSSITGGSLTVGAASGASIASTVSSGTGTAYMSLTGMSAGVAATTVNMQADPSGNYSVWVGGASRFSITNTGASTFTGLTSVAGLLLSTSGAVSQGIYADSAGVVYIRTPATAGIVFQPNGGTTTSNRLDLNNNLFIAGGSSFGGPVGVNGASAAFPQGLVSNGYFTFTNPGYSISVENVVGRFTPGTSTITAGYVNQRTYLFDPPTFSGAFTITNAATLTISGAPIAAGGAVLTNTYSLWVGAGATRLGGALTIDAGGASITGNVTIAAGTSLSTGTFPLVLTGSDVTLGTVLKIARSGAEKSMWLGAVGTTDAFIYTNGNFGINVGASDFSSGTRAFTISTSGGVTVPTGGLTVSAGGLTVTTGGITINGGGISVVGGQIVPYNAINFAGSGQIQYGGTLALTVASTTPTVTVASGLLVSAGVIQLADAATARISSTVAPLRINTGSGDLIFERNGGQVGRFRATDNFLETSYGLVILTNGIDASGYAVLRTPLGGNGGLYLTQIGSSALTATEAFHLQSNIGTLGLSGSFATQRFTVFQAPSITSSVTPYTVTTAATFAIAGAPTAINFATITNSYALWVQSGLAVFGGGVSITGSNFAVGQAAAASNIGIYNVASISAVGGFGYGYVGNNTLTAVANNDNLYGMALTPSFTVNAITGVSAYGLIVNGSGFTKAGTAAINTAYGLYASAPTIGTSNYAAYFAGVVAIGASAGSSTNLSIGSRDTIFTYASLDGLRVSGDDTVNTIYNASKAIGITVDLSGGGQGGLSIAAGTAVGTFSNGLVVTAGGVNITGGGYWRQVDGVATHNIQLDIAAGNKVVVTGGDLATVKWSLDQTGAVVQNNTLTVSAGGMGVTGASNFVGQVTATFAGTGAFTALSGAVGSFTSFTIGRTAGEADLGIAAVIGQWFGGTAVGDIVLRVTNSSSIIHLGAGAAASTLRVGNGALTIAGNGVNTGTFQAGTGSANYIQLAGAIAASNPALSVLGSDTNISLGILPKGTGSVVITSNGAPLAFGYVDATAGSWLRYDNLNTVLSNKTGALYYGYAGGASMSHHFIVGGGAGDSFTVNSNGTSTFASAVTISSGGATVTGDSTFNNNVFIKNGSPWYDVKAWGAKGDGTTNDTAAIQAALDAARVAGGGVVYMPAGTYLLSTTTTVTGFAVGCLSIGTNVVLVGAGMDVTILKPGNLNIDGVVINYNGTGNGTGAGNTNIEFRDFTIDCSNQLTTNHGDGFHLGTITRCRWQRVRVYNVYGNGVENAAWDLFFGSHLYLDDCEVDTTRSGASGFGFTQVTSSELNRCKAKGVVYRGFLCDYSSGIKYVNCQNYLGNSAVAQFDVTGAIDVEYVDCTAGGYATSTAGSPAGPSLPYTSGQNLGNASTGPGFNVAAAGTPNRIIYVGCLAAGNTTGNGFMIQSAANVRIIGGGSINNAIGYWMPTAAIAGSTRITGGPIATGNVTAPLQINAVNYATIEGGVTGPAVPATGTYIQNPFPFDSNVWINGGTVTGVFLASNGTGGNGVQVGAATPVLVRLPAGAFVAINYTVAPSWNWWID